MKPIGKVVERLGLGLDPFADDRPQGREDVDKRLVELAAKFRDNPVRLSNEVLAKLGISK